MKSIDFSKPGGFPLTQDQLDYLQTSGTERIDALGALGGDLAGPLAVSGMELSNNGNTVTSGWLYYGGEMIKFTGSVVAPSGSDVALVEITATATSLTFDDGSTPSVILEKTATLITGATLTDATHFPVSALKVWRNKSVTEVRPYAYIGGGNPNVVDLRRDRSIIYTNFHGAGSFPQAMTVDMTGAVPGVELYQYIPANGIGVYGVTINCSATVFNPCTGHNNKPSMLKIKYLGRVSGTDYVYMELVEWF